jgi:glycosyltransferase involved in cell wall biosynthesis
MTIQVMRDYKHLCKHKHQVFLYGTHDSDDHFNQIQTYTEDSGINILQRRGSTRWNRNLLRGNLFYKMLKDRSHKVVITRNYNKMKEALALKPLLGKVSYFLELHEDAFPHLLKSKKMSSETIKARYEKLFEQIDGLILTNYSQELILKQEFKAVPPYSVLPNGVELANFSQATTPKESSDKFVLTYTGQFTQWKNLELLFAALAKLDSRFHLRIAGGKGDQKSKELIAQWAEKYGVGSRVDYLGFLSQKELISKALDGSSALLLSLGDNMESRYFTSPMKLFEYMATKIPIVAVNYPSVNLISGTESVFLSPNDPTAFAEKIKEAVLGSEVKQRIATMNKIAAKYCYTVRSERFNNFLTSAV